MSRWPTTSAPSNSTPILPAPMLRSAWRNTTCAKRRLRRKFYARLSNLRDRVSERERFYIEAAYYSFATGDMEKANEVYTPVGAGVSQRIRLLTSISR